jgi:hypothetical protein
MNVEDFLQTHPNPPGNLDVIAGCVKACFGCAESCTMCADACLSEEQIIELRRCIRLNLDCAAVCIATGEIAARQTDPDRRVLSAQLHACIAACEVCGQECRRHASHHDHCKLCAESCQLCAEACQRLVEAL